MSGTRTAGRSALDLMRLVAVVAIAMAAASRAVADAPDPLRCWWRTSAGAVRVGEVFSVVLTCQVLETGALTAVVDHTPLEPLTLQLPPFDLVSGTHAPDLRTEGARFFQYEYKLRLVNDLLFGSDVALPDLAITYRVRTDTEGGEAIQGIEQTYTLPHESVRILSLVPDGASDIRDSSPTTFADLDDASLSADALITTGFWLSGLGGLFGAFAVARLVARGRTGAPDLGPRLSDGAVLGGVHSELLAVQLEREAGRWTSALVGRALAALRIVSACAVARPVAQRAADEERGTPEGTLALDRGWRGPRVLISGSVTPQLLSEAARRSTPGKGGDLERLRTMERALAAFTRASYRRDEAFETPELDDALSLGLQVARRLAVERRWLARVARSLARPLTARART